MIQPAFSSIPTEFSRDQLYNTRDFTLNPTVSTKIKSGGSFNGKIGFEAGRFDEFRFYSRRFRQIIQSAILSDDTVGDVTDWTRVEPRRLRRAEVELAGPAQNVVAPNRM